MGEVSDAHALWAAQIQKIRVILNPEIKLFLLHAQLSNFHRNDEAVSSFLYIHGLTSWSPEPFASQLLEEFFFVYIFPAVNQYSTWPVYPWSCPEDGQNEP